MCLAIFKPHGVRIDWDALECGFLNNSHGAGFAYAENDTLDLLKGFFSFDQFREAFTPHADKQAIIHFRWATHGDRNAKNCHPFLITPNLAMIHNGVLDIACDLDTGMSDTWHFATQVCQPLAERDIEFYTRDEVKYLGEQAIGSGNKFVFLRADGDWDIWNAEQGYWEGDVWYSNRGYQANTVPLIRGFDRGSLITTADRLEESHALGNLRDISYDPDVSDIYDDMTDTDQQLYDLLLMEGYDVETLDDLVESHGVNGLYDLIKTDSLYAKRKEGE